MANKTRILVLFGGESPEHEVSVITGLQVINHLSKEKYRIYGVYINKNGRWLYHSDLNKYERAKAILHSQEGCREVFLWNRKGSVYLKLNSNFLFRKLIIDQIDVVLPALHGGNGENGDLEGLFESLGVAYTCSGPKASAVNMDKVIEKYIFKAAGLPILPFFSFSQSDWLKRNDEIIEDLEKGTKSGLSLSRGVVVKPADLGSSIAVTKVKTQEEFIKAVELAFRFTDKILVEKYLTKFQEVNCSVLGLSEDNIKPSVCEEPVSTEDILTFEDKYLQGGKKIKGMASMGRKIPAPLKPGEKEKIQDWAVKAFQLTDCFGVVRVDFLIDREVDKIYINEINTIPGSLSFYLWEASGLTFTRLLDELISAALVRQDKRKNLEKIFNSQLLQEFLKH